MNQWSLKDEKALLAQGGLANLEFFARNVLGFTHPQNRKGSWWSDEVHRPLCTWLQEQYEDWLQTRRTIDERRYLAVLVPRACAKSLLVTRASMVWLHLQDPDLATYIGNEKLELAEDFLSTIKAWLEGTANDKYNLFTWLYGSWKGDSKRWRQDNITHAVRKLERTESSFGVWSPNSGLTGRHPDILCMDDLVSYDALKKDVDWFDYAYSHTTDLIPVVERNGLIILVGTRYGDNDPFGRSFKADGIRSISGHTDYEEYKPRKDGRWDVYFLSGRLQDGTPAIPTVWSDKEMRLMEMRDPIKAAAQILNRPRAHTLRPLTEEQFDTQIVTDLPKKALVVFHLDTAFKSNKRLAAGSESAINVIGHHLDEPGHATVFESISRLRVTAKTFAALVIDRYKYWTANGYTVDGITDEAEMAGKMGLWQQYLSDEFTREGLELPAFHTFNRHVGEKKEIRIADAIHFIVSKQVWFYKESESFEELRKQLCNHPNSFPNDLADCFADTFNPAFFSGLLPKLIADKEEVAWGAHEQRLKPRWFQKSDILADMEFEREPIRRGQPDSDASPEYVHPSGVGGVAPSPYR